jgi:tetratricopeptide (TPR) repeat protein
LADILPADTLPGIAKPREALFGFLNTLAEGGSPEPVLLQGPQASGRRQLLHETASAAKAHKLDVLEIEVPPFGHDTPAQMLLQIAALAPMSHSADTLLDISAKWQARTSAATTILKESSVRVILVRLPAGSLPAGDRADRPQQETADVLRVLTQSFPGKFCVVAAQTWWKWPHEAPVHRLDLKVSSNAKKFLSDASFWGTLAPSAAKLLALLGTDGDRVSPLQLRLGVALLSTGAEAARVRGALHPGALLRDLETPLRRMLESRPELAAALSRISRARTAVAAEVLEDVANAGEHWDLVLRCFLYPAADGRLRFHDQLRWLVQDSTPETAAHEKLRNYYGTLDGALEPRKGLSKVIPWLEKLHHASRADAIGNIDAWLALRAPTREHYWEYGWSLSYVHKRHAEAARVFRVLLDRVADDDNYGQHYYAWNLDKAGGDPLEAERFYRKAVEGDPTNPWWNSRLVSFLTARGRFESALLAWSASLDAVDPEGSRSGGDWLPYHLHKHVIKAGLESGDLELAQAALRAVRAPACDDEVFRWLDAEVKAFREVRRLGEALFPATESVLDWWQPRLLRARQNETLSDWRAGRVLKILDSDVHVALGYRIGEAAPLLEYQRIQRKHWLAAAQGKKPKVGDFFEVAKIDGQLRVESESPAVLTADLELLASSVRFISTAAWRK